MPNISRSTKILIAIAIILLLIAIVFIVISKNKTTPSTSLPSGSTNQTAPALPQSTSSKSIPSESSSQPTSQNTSSGAITPPVQEPPTSESFSIEKQADYSYDTVKGDSAIASSAQNAKGDFKLNDIGVSLPVATTKLKDGDEITLLSGCTPHNCGGTNIVIAYDNRSKKAYILAERVGTALGYQIYGDPSDETKNLLVYYFLHN